MEELQVKVKCPVCTRRILDKISLTSGEIKIKCPHCRNEVVLNLALRVSRRRNNYDYRWDNSSRYI